MDSEKIIEFPGNCARIEEIELAIDRFFKKNNSPREVHFDLSYVEYITASALLHIIAITHRFLNLNIDVKYYLPENIRIRNILRRWRFAVELQKSTGRKFASMVRLQDIKYFGESDLSGDTYDTYLSRDEGLTELMKKDYFALNSIPFESEDEKAISVDNEHDKWDVQLIKSILKRHLKDFSSKNEDILPNRVIAECMSNAYRHSSAKNLISGSFFDKLGSVFTLSYWDDGDSILKTLHKRLKNKETLRNNNAFISGDIHFTVVTKSNEPVNLYYHSASDVPNDIKDAELFLYSFFPGISRDPLGNDRYKKNQYLSDDKPEEERYNKPGMGLTTLLTAVIDLLNGTVAVRSGEYFINFSKPEVSKYKKYVQSKEYKAKTLYKAKIIRYQHMPEFCGNMITIKLPLKS